MPMLGAKNLDMHVGLQFNAREEHHHLELCYCCVHRKWHGESRTAAFSSDGRVQLLLDLHSLAVKMGQQTNTAIGNNIIMMHTRNESVSDSRKAFENILELGASLGWQGIGQQIHCNLIKTSLIPDTF